MTEFALQPTITNAMACRFGAGAPVPATLLNPTTLACVAPPAAPAGADGGNATAAAAVVPVEVTLDGGAQWTHDGQAFAYCPEGDVDCLRAHASCPHGWKGPGCDVECRGGAADPCGGRGFCVDEPPGACQCRDGYAGEACERADPVALAAAAAAAKAAAAPGDGDVNQQQGSALGRGVAMGLGLAALVLVAVGGLLYTRRDAVAERVFWSLAASRFDRLHPRPAQEEEGAGASTRHVELVRSAASPSPPFLPRHHHHHHHHHRVGGSDEGEEDIEMDADITVLG